MTTDANLNCKKLFAICNRERSTEELTRVITGMSCYPSSDLLTNLSQPGFLLESWLIWQAKPEFSSCFQYGEFRSWFPVWKDFSEGLSKANKHIIPQNPPTALPCPVLPAVWAEGWGINKESERGYAYYSINMHQIGC